MVKRFFIFAILFFATLPAFASETTHLLGTSGYMIREAMQVGAGKKDPENYRRAVMLQKQARQAFRGTRKKGGRNLQEARDLAKQAYDLAKLARDHSKKWPYETSQDHFYKSLSKKPAN